MRLLLIIAAALASFQAQAAQAAQTASSFKAVPPTLAAAMTVALSRSQAGDLTLDKLKAAGGDERLAPLAEALRESGKLEAFAAADEAGRTQLIEQAATAAAHLVESRARDLLLQAEAAQTLADVQRLHGEVDQFLTLYGPYQIAPRVYEGLKYSRSRLWKHRAALLEQAVLEGAAGWTIAEADAVPAAHAHGYYVEDLSPGMTASYSKTVAEKDIEMFAAVSGDNQPVHMDEAFAAQTIFKGRIAHGMLSAAFISAALGTKLPGPGVIYMSQDLKFRAPVRIGDTVVTRVTVKEVIKEKRRVILTTVCTVDGKVVLEGEAMLLVDAKPTS